MIFFGEKIKGLVVWKNVKLRETYLAGLPDCKLKMEIVRHRNKRTDNQNRLYWLWISIIAQDTGYYPDELHASFRAMFLTDHSRKIPLVRSTTKLNSLEFMTYLNRIELEAGKMKIVLPDPEDYWAEYKNVI